MQQWTLMMESVRLGSLTFKRTDQPFCHCHFDPTAAFASFASLFDAELRSLNEDNMAQWEHDYQKIDRLGLTLLAADGSAAINQFILHISDGEAWFRV